MLIRDATTADARGIARVHVHSWQSAYLGLLPQDVLDGLSIEDRVERWVGILAEPATNSHTLVVEAHGEILAWASFGAARDDDAPATGELWGIYAHPDSWSTGVGRALLAAVEDALREDGHRSAYLWVLDGNDRAADFYERHGWTEDGGTKLDERPGFTLSERRRVKQLIPEI
ncbi:GNAT family N-acetyltransferase [Microbacterium sp. A84]|uniref:GNAT family N-acetyltransferase n=1 Tax=Microbacterium sp. A84 TaxID=3450715 RepID=UPI003F42408D